MIAPPDFKLEDYEPAATVVKRSREDNLAMLIACLEHISKIEVSDFRPLECPVCGAKVIQRFGRHERLYIALHDCRDGCHIGRGATPEIATEFFLSTFNN